MPHSIKRREFLSLAAVAAGVVVVSNARADNAVPAIAEVQATTPEGIALVSVAYATVGYPVSAVVADEVRKKLSGYPGGFAVARAVPLPDAISPSMGLTHAFHVKRPPVPKKKTDSNPKPTVPASAGDQSLPSSNDVKPLPVPSGTIQN